MTESVWLVCVRVLAFSVVHFVVNGQCCWYLMVNFIGVLCNVNEILWVLKLWLWLQLNGGFPSAKEDKVNMLTEKINELVNQVKQAPLSSLFHLFCLWHLKQSLTNWCKLAVIVEWLGLCIVKLCLNEKKFIASGSMWLFSKRGDCFEYHIKHFIYSIYKQIESQQWPFLYAQMRPKLVFTLHAFEVLDFFLWLLLALRKAGQSLLVSKAVCRWIPPGWVTMSEFTSSAVVNCLFD